MRCRSATGPLARLKTIPLTLRLMLVLLCALSALMWPRGPASAQVSGSVPLQQFQPTQPNSEGYSHLWTAGTPGHLQPGFGLWLNYAYRPLILRRNTTGDSVALVEHDLEADILAALGLGRRFVLTLAVPFTPFLAQGETGFVVPPEVAGAGLGDVRLGGACHLIGEGTGFQAAVAALVTLPTGAEERYLGNAGPTIEPKLVAQLALSKNLGLAANLGFQFRPDQQAISYSGTPLITVGNEVTYGLGARFRPGGGGMDLTAELFGRLGPGEGFDGSSVPLEVDLFARKRLGDGGHALSLGVGTGLVGGYGSPEGRVLFGYSYAPAPNPDSDGDGVPDASDLCPGRMEDSDGFKDQDGCPDPDNDLDRVKDERDGCPDDAEDPDEFEDEDGCPDPDNDRDGIPDEKDHCPRGPEDFDNFQDDDGCPEADNDGDLILDIVDRCPNQAEDPDGLDDENGCPEKDFDHDGIDDEADLCPRLPETINGIKDEDGCPDKGESAVRVTTEKIEILQKVFFETNKAKILPRSFGLLNQVAAVLKAHSEINRLRVEGHTDDMGDDTANRVLSQKRAEEVKAYLATKGVATERLEAIGYGETRPLVPNQNNEARARNRRVEFRILEIDGKPVGDATGPESQPGLEKNDGSEPSDTSKVEPDHTVDPGSPDESPPSAGAPPVPVFSGETADFPVMVFFVDGSGTLSLRGERVCSDFAAWMGEAPGVRVQLKSFSDDSGAEAKDIERSRVFARTIKSCLVAHGVAAARIVIHASGSMWPRQPNDSPAHRAENRRVRLLPVDARGQPLTALPVELRVDLPAFAPGSGQAE